MKYYLSVCLLLFSFSAHGGLVKWVDANGKVHYSDGPPPADVQVQKLVVPAAPAGGDAPAARTIAEQEADYQKTKKKKEDDEQKAAKAREQAQAKQNNCSAARSNLTAIENSPRLITYNDKGESSYMNDAARQQQMAAARKAISENCK